MASYTHGVDNLSDLQRLGEVSQSPLARANKPAIYTADTDTAILGSLVITIKIAKGIAVADAPPAPPRHGASIK